MTFYLATACMFAMYGGCLAFMRNNSRYQHTIMHRLKREVPLDDIVHARVPAHLATTGIRRWVDLVVSMGPLLVLSLAWWHSAASDNRAPAIGHAGWHRLCRDILHWLRHEFGLLDYLLEFGALALYKQVVCVSTRLPPATQEDNIRECLGVCLASWTDYGISGHSGLTILLWLHLGTWPALVLAVCQSCIMVITRDHYTIDVLHAWVFCFAIVGKFRPITAPEAY